MASSEFRAVPPNYLCVVLNRDQRVITIEPVGFLRIPTSAAAGAVDSLPLHLRVRSLQIGSPFRGRGLVLEDLLYIAQEAW